MDGRINRNEFIAESGLFNDWEDKWTEWHMLISPDQPESGGFTERISTKGDLLGYKAGEPFMNGWFGKYDDGIYELMTIGPRGGNQNVVYVGKTSSQDDKSLKERLQAHTRWQSDQRENINNALEKNLTILARVLPSEETDANEDPEDMEDKCLNYFRYPWNIQKNKKRTSR